MWAASMEMLGLALYWVVLFSRHSTRTSWVTAEWKKTRDKPKRWNLEWYPSGTWSSISIRGDDTEYFRDSWYILPQCFLERLRPSRSYQNSAWNKHSTVWVTLLSVCYKILKTLIEGIETSIVHENWYLFAFYWDKLFKKYFPLWYFYLLLSFFSPEMNIFLIFVRSVYIYNINLWSFMLSWFS